MTHTYRELNRQWIAATESSDPDPTLIGELYLGMREEAAISAAYSAAMEESFHNDPTGQDYEGAGA